jgi:hypothetical protein
MRRHSKAFEEPDTFPTDSRRPSHGSAPMLPVKRTLPLDIAYVKDT